MFLIGCVCKTVLDRQPATIKLLKVMQSKWMELEFYFFCVGVAKNERIMLETHYF